MTDPQLLRQLIANELTKVAPQDLPELYDLVKKFAFDKARRRRPTHSLR